MGKNALYRQFRNQLNLLIIKRCRIPIPQDELEQIRTDFLLKVGPSMGEGKRAELLVELSEVTPEIASSRTCGKCKQNQGLDQFYVSKLKDRILDMCKSCRQLKSQNDKNYGIHFFTNSLSSAKKRALSKGLAFDIDVDYLHSIFPKDRKCPVFGTVMKSGIRGDMEDSASLDKIDPKKGYVKGNVWYISMRANRIKSDHTLSDILLTAFGMLKKSKEIGLDEGIAPELERALAKYCISNAHQPKN